MRGKLSINHGTIFSIETMCLIMSNVITQSWNYIDILIIIRVSAKLMLRPTHPTTSPAKSKLTMSSTEKNCYMLTHLLTHMVKFHEDAY